MKNKINNMLGYVGAFMGFCICALMSAWVLKESYEIANTWFNFIFN